MEIENYIKFEEFYKDNRNKNISIVTKPKFK